MHDLIQKYIGATRELWRNVSNANEDTLGSRVLSILMFAESLVCFFWIYTISGLGSAYAIMAITPYAYLIFSYVSLLIFYRTKHYQYFIFTQLTMLLVMPFFLQWSIGGYEASSGIAIWAVLSPTGALMILGTRKSTPWFLLFLLLAGFSWKFNELFSANPLPMPATIKNSFFLMNIIGLTCILYAAMRYFQSQKERTMHALSHEQARSEKLLLNVLPASIAQRLKDNDMRIAETYPSVTILFADLVGFTALTTKMPPFELVSLLSQIFSVFDQIVETMQLEKIKTLGDGYLVVGGAPRPLENHALAVVKLAFQMREVLLSFNQATGHDMHMRIGISTGPVVAGVIGTTKFAYDIWGDTVNMASRMEQTGLTDQIQISEDTYQHIQHAFDCEKREAVAVKGKGALTTYLVKSLKHGYIVE